MSTWQLQEAKAHFSEVARKAETEGPQNVTIRGEEKIIIISKKDYDRLTKKKKKLSFIEMMRQSPAVGIELNIERDKSLPRDTDALFD
jgi:prevent-host-death family protein